MLPAKPGCAGQSPPHDVQLTEICPSLIHLPQVLFTANNFWHNFFERMDKQLYYEKGKKR